MRIVFATDLSEASEAAIRSRTCLACLGRIGVEEVHLVTVLPSNVGIPGASLESSRRRTLDAQREVFESAGFAVETHVVRGEPHRRINGIADHVDAGLIVVGSRGASPLENRFVGSTTRNVARTAVVPLLVERIAAGDEGDGPEVVREHLFEHVLFATDFSENADRAFEFLPTLSGATRRVTLLYVLGREGRDAGLTPVEARERLDALAADLDPMGVETEVSVREGGPVGEILAEEGRVEPTVTLLGSRGRSPLRRLLLGSVSESVVARGRGNVLLVPPGSPVPR
jgi:nucleotide-binding universal stress UspA family protein